MRPPCHTQHGGQSLCSCPSWGCRSLSPNRRAGRFLVMRWRHRGAQSGDTDTPWRTPFTSVRPHRGKGWGRRCSASLLPERRRLGCGKSSLSLPIKEVRHPSPCTHATALLRSVGWAALGSSLISGLAPSCCRRRSNSGRVEDPGGRCCSRGGGRGRARHQTPHLLVLPGEGEGVGPFLFFRAAIESPESRVQGGSATLGAVKMNTTKCCVSTLSVGV